MPRATDPTHRAFPETADPTRVERPPVGVDVAALTAADGGLHALLVRRDEQPQRGRWSLPGGLLAPDESLDAAAARALHAKAALRRVFLEQLYTFGAPRRDPRGRIVAVAYYALVAPERLRRAVGNHEREALAQLKVPWAGEAGGPVGAIAPDGAALALAFDHAEILGMAVKRIRGKLDYAPIGFQLLPARFTLRDLQGVHEAVLGRRLNKDSFRRRMLVSGQLEATGDREHSVGHRPAELYRFTRRSAI